MSVSTCCLDESGNVVDYPVPKETEVAMLQREMDSHLTEFLCTGIAGTALVGTGIFCVIIQAPPLVCLGSLFGGVIFGSTSQSAEQKISAIADRISQLERV